jgi:hypothetical protein
MEDNQINKSSEKYQKSCNSEASLAESEHQ